MLTTETIIKTVRILEKGEVQMKQVNVAYGCITNSSNQILLVYNQDAQHWSMPGGKVEKDECLDAACIREVYEETGYKIKVNQLIALNECKLLNSKEHALFFTFHCDIIGGKETITNPDEISKIAWVSFEEANQRMPYHQKSVKDLLNNYVDYINQGEQS